MKNMVQIAMDFNQANRQADTLDGLADNLDNLADHNLNSCMTNIAGNWRGESANQYVKRGKIVEGNLKSTADKLRQAAISIRQIAENTYNAEKAAVSAAEKRTYRQT